MTNKFSQIRRFNDNDIRDWSDTPGFSDGTRPLISELSSEDEDWAAFIIANDDGLLLYITDSVEPTAAYLIPWQEDAEVRSEMQELIDGLNLLPPSGASFAEYVDRNYSNMQIWL